MRLAAEDDWSARGGPLAFQIGLATFGILALELALKSSSGNRTTIDVKPVR